MTIEEFEKTGFGAGDRAEYKGVMHPIRTVDFEEKLVGIPANILTGGCTEDDVTWVRCENVKYFPAD